MLKCEHCLKEFISKKGLKYHIKKKVCKSKKLVINCLFCNKKYYNKNIFLKHLNNKHKKKIDANNIQNKIKKNLNCKESITNIYDELNNINKSNIEKLDNIMLNIKESLNTLEENLYDNKILKFTKSNNPDESIIDENIIDEDKIKKSIIKNNIIDEDIIEKNIITENIIEKKYLICKYCNKQFSRNDSLKRHYKQFCKRIKKERKTINIINTTNNFNLITSVKINNFTKENLKSISNDDIINIINRCYSCIPILFKKIHIDIPENRNLYLTSIKNQFLYAYQNNKWELNDIKQILNVIKDKKINIVEEFIENNKDKFTKFKINNLYKMLDDYKNGKLHTIYNKKLKLLMINYKNILKESYDRNN